MEDEEIRELARAYMTGIFGVGPKQQEKVLVDFGREVAHRTQKWAISIVFEASNKIANRPYR